MKKGKKKDKMIKFQNIIKIMNFNLSLIIKCK